MGSFLLLLMFEGLTVAQPPAAPGTHWELSHFILVHPLRAAWLLLCLFIGQLPAASRGSCPRQLPVGF